MENTHEQPELDGLLSAVAEMAATAAAQIPDAELRTNLGDILATAAGDDLAVAATAGMTPEPCHHLSTNTVNLHAAGRASQARAIADAYWEAAEIRAAARHHAAAIKAEADRTLADANRRAEEMLQTAGELEDAAITNAADMIGAAREQAKEILAEAREVARAMPTPRLPLSGRAAADLGVRPRVEEWVDLARCTAGDSPGNEHRVLMIQAKTHSVGLSADERRAEEDTTCKFGREVKAIVSLIGGRGELELDSPIWTSRRQLSPRVAEETDVLLCVVRRPPGQGDSPVSEFRPLAQVRISGGVDRMVEVLCSDDDPLNGDVVEVTGLAIVTPEG